MEQNEVFTKAAETALNSVSLTDKFMAAGAISGDTSYFYFKEEEIIPEHKVQLDLLLLKHMIMNGPKGLMMAVHAGRAIKASIENPIKPKTGVIQRFKDKIKECLQ
jgi:hypothetical protein